MSHRLQYVAQRLAFAFSASHGSCWFRLGAARSYHSSLRFRQWKRQAGTFSSYSGTELSRSRNTTTNSMRCQPVQTEVTTIPNKHYIQYLATFLKHRDWELRRSRKPWVYLLFTNKHQLGIKHRDVLSTGSVPQYWVGKFNSSLLYSLE